MKYVYLLNRFSLKDKLDSLVKRIDQVSKKRKLNYVIEINDLNTSTEDIVEKYKDKKCILLAVGGDGTINRVLNKVVGTNNMLGFIPYGTGNDFYKTCQETLKEKVNEIDLIKINEKYFINVACFGIDAEIGNNDEIIHSKLIPEKQRYNMSLLLHFIKFKAKRMKVKAKNCNWDEVSTTVVVCNGRYYGGGYKVGYTSELQNGVVDLYLIKKVPKLMMAKLIMGMKKGQHEKSSYTTKLQVKELTIESSERAN